jgi:hypothetical protein
VLSAALAVRVATAAAVAALVQEQLALLIINQHILVNTANIKARLKQDNPVCIFLNYLYPTLRQAFDYIQVATIPPFPMRNRASKVFYISFTQLSHD